MNRIVLEPLYNSLIAPEQDSLDLRERWGVSVRTDEIQERIDYLLSIGFSEVSIEGVRNISPTLHHKEYVHDKILELKRLGFKNPMKMIKLFPLILNFGIENIERKIENLKELWFENPIKIITWLPAIIGLKIDNIKEKIQNLKELGFSNPIKMISIIPMILGFSMENIERKIEDLKELGFSNPIKMIISQPSILGYGIENIERKIESFKKLGFENPIKMIALHPSILGYSMEKNIQKKYDIFSYFIEKYNLPYTVIELIEVNPSILGTKQDKIWTLIRILSERKWTDLNNMSKIKQLTQQNLEQIIIIYQTYPDITSIAELITQSKILKKSLQSSGKIKNIIQQNQDSKILKRYARGYIKTGLIIKNIS